MRTPPWRYVQLFFAPDAFVAWSKRRAKERVEKAERIAAAAERATIDGDDKKARRLLIKLMRV